MSDEQVPRAKLDPGDDLSGTTVGRFAIRVRLGAGGMGEVYRADDTKLKRTVALKRLAPRLRADEHYRRRFVKEAERASRLSYEHIAGIYDIIEESGETFLVMEYVEGETFRQRLARPLSVEELLPLALQCAEALATAHEKGIVHRDIKPENIMLTPAGQVKILDFGVARALPHYDPETVTHDTEEASAALSGTPAYMAPEELLQRDSDHRADLFSLGVVFYEALTGRHPFRRGSFVATADSVLHDPPLPPRQLNPAIPDALEAIVLRLLAKDPKERFASATELRQALARLAGAELLPARVRPFTRRSALLLSGLVVVALALVLASSRTAREGIERWFGGTVPPEKHLAVLPIINVGGDPAHQAFSDGLTYTLTNRLTQLEQFHGSLLVVPVSEVLREDVRSVEEARQRFAVSLVLAGSLQRAGPRMVLDVNLVDARTLRQLRSFTLDAAADDPMALQSDVVHEVARLLELELQPPAERLLAAGRTGVARAYDHYLQGRGYLARYEKPENIDLALGQFRRALELDPTFALAEAGRGEASWRKYELTKEASWVVAARQACERALALEQALAEPHVCLGTLYNGTGEHEKAAEAFERALGRDPHSAQAYRGLARAQERLGQAAEAERTYRRAIELRPGDWAGYSWLGVYYYRRGRYPEAAEMFEKVVALTPDNARGYDNLGGVYHLMGRGDDAIAAFRKSLAMQPTPSTYSNIGTVEFFRHRYADSARAFEKAAELRPNDYLYWGNLADAYYFAPGERPKADVAYRRALALAEEELRVNPRDAFALVSLAHYRAKTGQAGPAREAAERALALAPDDMNVVFFAAIVHESLGRSERALELLRRAQQQGYSALEIANHPELAALRARPEFPKQTQP
jgi:serine/threonine-protein kinase